MKIIKYTPKWKEKWDAFVLQSNNGTIFHLQQFFRYHAPDKFQFYHLMFIKNGEIVGVLPGRLKDGIYESPIGSSYGSIVTEDIKFSLSMELVSALLNYARKNKFREIYLTSAPLIYEKYPNQNLDFAMLWQGFKYKTHYISSAIALDPKKDIINRFQRTVRNTIRRSLRDKNIRVEIKDDYESFYPILIDNLSRHKVRPTHSLDELIQLKSLLPNHIKLFMVYYQNKPIGGSLVFLCNPQVALCFYNMLYYKYAEYKPIQRVIYEVVKYASEQNYKYVDMGVSQDTAALNPMTPSNNLIAFKETFDAKTIMRNTFSITL